MQFYGMARWCCCGSVVSGGEDVANPADIGSSWAAVYLRRPSLGGWSSYSRVARTYVARKSAGIEFEILGVVLARSTAISYRGMRVTDVKEGLRSCP